MIEELEQAQAHVSGMREDLLKKGSVYPMDGESSFLSYEAKKKVLWYLDLVAARIAGAHRHISNFSQDDIFSDVEKVDMQSDVLEMMRRDLGRLLPPAIKNYFYCFGNHFEDMGAHTSGSSSNTCLTKGLEKKREVVKEIFDQLELLDGEVDFICGELKPSRPHDQVNGANNKGGLSGGEARPTKQD